MTEEHLSRELTSTSSAPAIAVSTSTLPEPSTHSYLGPSTQDIYLRHVLQAEHCYNIILYPLPDIVVFPGETVPLVIQNVEIIRLLQDHLTSANRADLISDIPEQRGSSSAGRIQNTSARCYIGVVRISHANPRGGILGSVAQVGTAVEIRALHQRNSADSLIGNRNMAREELAVTGRAKHRFQIISLAVESGVLKANVKILGDSLSRNAVLPAGVNPFPAWIYEINNPRRLARIAYSLYAATMSESVRSTVYFINP